MAGFRTAFVLAAWFLAIWVASSAAIARDTIELPLESPSVDILQAADKVETEFPTTTVQVENSQGQTVEVQVQATGQSRRYRWLVFTVKNIDQKPVSRLVAVGRDGVTGTGLYGQNLVARRVRSVSVAEGVPPVLRSDGNIDSFLVEVPPGGMRTYIVEIAGAWPENLILWAQWAFDAQRQRISFFHGLLIGIATLGAIYIGILFIVRRTAIFPAAALFAFAGVAYLCFELGYWPLGLSAGPQWITTFRTVVVAFLCLGLLAILLTFLELRRRWPIASTMTIMLGGLTVPLMAASIWFPGFAYFLAWLVLVIIVALGCFLIGRQAMRGMIRAQVTVPAWVLVAIWSFFAALQQAGFINHAIAGPALAATLVLVVLMIAFTVTQFAFDASVISSRFFEDSGRRALALAGSEQCVWDWHEKERMLYVGPEIEVMLGLPVGGHDYSDPDQWLELVHPADRIGYLSTVDAAIQRGRGTFRQAFRLRRNDGTYRWFQLRARAMPDEHGRAARCIGTLADVTAVRAAEERLLRDAVHDSLTGLPNRALFVDRLEQTLQQFEEGDRERQIAVFVVDLDRFKNVNDGLGHAVGDSLLLTMARRIKRCLGPGDTIARVSGDQFGIIFNTTMKSGETGALAEQIRLAISAPVRLNPREVFLTASIGVAQFSGKPDESEDLLKNAEIALYQAKRLGKNKIEFFRSSMRDDRSSRVALESDLRRALERGEMDLLYQPIVRLADMRVAGFEALIRWHHPQLGMLNPDDFIDIAEETGMITDIGLFAINEASRQLGTWQRAFTPNDPVFASVNMSSRQILSQDLVEDVEMIMTRADLVDGTLKLEITETLIMENPELSAKILDRLRQLGAGISCDDFGTGYSSLSNLQRFPFDTIKIDRSFLQNSNPDDPAAEIILHSIVALAHDLDMDVVAEGAESQDDIDLLREIGCEFAQGFYFGEPMSAQEAISYLAGKPGNWS